MLKVQVLKDAVRIGPVRVSFMRTLRIPDDGRDYPLPPGLGRFPVHRVADYADRVPPAWRERGGVFIPMYQREALWLSFGADWPPHALKVGVGKIDAITGEAWSEALAADPQNYLVVPDHPWLDGINAGDGFIRQFVAMPLGSGYTVEGQLTGEELFGGIQLAVFAPKPGRFPDPVPRGPNDLHFFVAESAAFPAAAAAPDMGLGAGGRMRQKLYPDDHGLGTWDAANHGRLFVHNANSEAYREITGREPPPTPVDARLYTKHGYPWFDLYDEHKADLAPSGKLAGVKSIKELDAEKGLPPQPGDQSLDVPGDQVKKLPLGPVEVPDGKW